MVGDDFTDVWKGSSHQCAKKVDGSLWCWGSNGHGQLGDGSGLSQNDPIEVNAPIDWATAEVGTSHTCGIADDGRLFCWGRGDSGQLGTGNIQEVHQPALVDDLSQIHSVSAGRSHTCAIRSDRSLWCFGAAGPWLGLGSNSENELFPRKVEGSLDWLMVDAGGQHTCGIRDPGSLWCFGRNFEGEVGRMNDDGFMADIDKPLPVTRDSNWKMVSAGENHTCAVKQDGTLWCCGSNESGKLGLNTSTGEKMPRQVDQANDWTSVSAGRGHSCAIQAPGLLYCFGLNQSGQLGDGTTVSQASATRVGLEEDWIAVSAGSSHTCGLRDGGSLWCWGTRSMLGTDVPGDMNRAPQRVGLEFWTQVQAGASHSCAVRADGTEWCWGNNGLGQLGTGNTDFGFAPEWVFDGKSGVAQTTVGQSHTCAIRDGILLCWGEGLLGRLGTGKQDAEHSPVRPGVRTTVEEEEDVECQGHQVACMGGPVALASRSLMGFAEILARIVPPMGWCATPRRETCVAAACLGGQVACGEALACQDSSDSACGNACTDCTAMDATCGEGGQCVCGQGELMCGGRCVAQSDVACGSGCNDCTPSSQVCDLNAGACVTPSCSGDNVACGEGGTCIAPSDTICGDSCTDCTATNAACDVNGQCVCAEGEFVCDGTCAVPSDTACGAACTASSQVCNLTTLSCEAVVVSVETCDQDSAGVCHEFGAANAAADADGACLAIGTRGTGCPGGAVGICDLSNVGSNPPAHRQFHYVSAFISDALQSQNLCELANGSWSAP